VLELIKINRIAAVQDSHFGDIMVEGREPEKGDIADPEEALAIEGGLL
jgi:hypothetical protein